MQKQNMIGVGDFKTHCLSLMSKVYESKKPITITKRGKPFIKIIPYIVESPPVFGYMKGFLKTKGNIYSTGEKWSGDEDNI